MRPCHKQIGRGRYGGEERDREKGRGGERGRRDGREVREAEKKNGFRVDQTVKGKDRLARRNQGANVAEGRHPLDRSGHRQ